MLLLLLLQFLYKTKQKCVENNSFCLLLAVLFVCRTYNLVIGENEIKSRIAMSKRVFNKKKTLSTSNFDFSFSKILVIRYNQSAAPYGAETWTHQKDQKYGLLLKF